MKKKNDIYSISLLIYIPSYNRYDRLCEQIEYIQPYLSKYNIKLIVSNNSSIDKRYDKLREKYLNSNITIINNCINIGGNPNIFNGFLYCIEYDYVWILSDDDTLLKNSIDIIMELLIKDSDIIYLTSNKNISETKSYNINEILSILNYGLGLISCIIYKTCVIKDDIIKGYEYLNSGFPHLSIMFSACKRRGSLTFLQYSSDNILDLTRSEKPTESFTKENIYFSLYGFIFLSDFIIDKKLQKIFIKGYIHEYIWNIMRYRPTSPIRYKNFIGYIYSRSFGIYLYFNYEKLKYSIKKPIYNLFLYIPGGKPFLKNLDKIIRLRKNKTMKRP